MKYRTVNKKSNRRKPLLSKEPVRFPLNIVQISFVSYMNMKVPFLKRISMRCLKSSSFYNAGSNNSKGLTRKSKNRIKENSEIPDSK